MLNFEEELQKFTPIMEVDDIEDALYQKSHNRFSFQNRMREAFLHDALS